MSRRLPATETLAEGAPPDRPQARAEATTPCGALEQRGST